MSSWALGLHTTPAQRVEELLTPARTHAHTRAHTHTNTHRLVYACADKRYVATHTDSQTSINTRPHSTAPHSHTDNISPGLPQETDAAMFTGSPETFTGRSERLAPAPPPPHPHPSNSKCVPPPTPFFLFFSLFFPNVLCVFFGHLYINTPPCLFVRDNNSPRSLLLCGSKSGAGGGGQAGGGGTGGGWRGANFRMDKPVDTRENVNWGLEHK